MSRRCITVALVCVLAACAAPRATVVALAPRPLPPAPDSAAIPFFQSTPTCVFDEIALVSIVPSRFWQKPEDLVTELRSTARTLGGDAVVRVTSKHVVDGATRNAYSGGADLDTHTELFGTVVRFRDAGCMR